MERGLLCSVILTTNTMFNSFDDWGIDVKDDLLYTLTREYLESDEKYLMDIGSPEYAGMDGTLISKQFFSKQVKGTSAVIKMDYKCANTVCNVLTYMAFSSNRTVRDLLTDYPNLYNECVIYYRGHDQVQKVALVESSAKVFMGHCVKTPEKFAQRISKVVQNGNTLRRVYSDAVVTTIKELFNLETY